MTRNPAREGRSTASLVSLALLLAVAWSPARAQAPSPGPLEVAVRWAEGGKPVDRAQVRLGGRFAATGPDGGVVFDGVPAGTYALVVDHPDGQRAATEVALPPGSREPVQLALARTVLADVAGVVVLADTEQPVPGARVALVPKVVGASCQGRFDFASGWDGRFLVPDVPDGVYAATVALPGCAVLTTDVVVAAGGEPVRLQLERESEPTDLLVDVVDAVRGTPIEGAVVAVAEAWPRAELARGATGGDGAAHLEDLRVGRLDWATADDTVTIARRRATVRVERDGYEPALALVTLRPGAVVRVRLNPTDDIVEAEPNDTLEAPQPIRPGAPVRFHLDRVGDDDVFELRLEEPAFVRIVVGPANPLQVHVDLLDARGTRIEDRGSYSGQTNTIARGLLAGRYLLRITEWGRDAAHDAELVLRVDRETAADPHEPNDAPATARALRSGEELRGTILPRGDEDWFRFELERDGTVRFTMPPHALQRELVLQDEGGARRGSVGVHGGQPLALVVGLEAGRYLACVREWGNDAESSEPFTLRFDLAEGDGVRDGAPATCGRTLAPGSLVGSTLDPVGDRDLFAVPLDTAGQLRLSARATTQHEVLVLDRDGTVLARGAAHGGQRSSVVWNAEGPTVALVQVREWGDDDRSASPYTLRAWWEPCDEGEALARNDDLPQASPFEPGETLRGSVTPLRDRDVYRLDLDHPGYLELTGQGPTQLDVRILDASGRALASTAGHRGQRLTVGADVPAGAVFVDVREWGGDDAQVGSYALATALRRAEVEERGALRDDPVRALRLGEARSFAVDQVKDRDRFLCDVPRAGTVTFTVTAPSQVEWTVFDDRTGAKVVQQGQHANQVVARKVEAAGPTRFRVELVEWGEDARASGPGLVQADLEGRALAGERIAASVDPVDPTRATFRRAAWAGLAAAAEVRVDADGDGTFDLALPSGGQGEFRYRAEGSYPATALLLGAEGQSTRLGLWVDAVGPHEKKGVRVLVQHPPADATIDAAGPARVRAVSYTGVPVRDVTLLVDGQAVATAYRSPFELDVPWRSLGSGAHELRVIARDARGESGTAVRSVRVSDYFDLQPADGAVLSGDAVTVSWRGPEFGPARVRVRAQGEADWRDVVGSNAKDPRVVLGDLEPGRTYEIQPLGAGEPGPVRAVTRVKGLAFGKAVYGANLARDYDQRVPVSVRNHAEVPQIVRLECGRPDSELLLAGFVGDGSEGAPFELGPGEEREFLLGVSAQDVVTAEHAFAIRIASEAGFSDEARVELNVRLPNVDLAWTELGPTVDGLGRRMQVENRGDTLTDLRIGSADDALLVSPGVEHGLLRAGERREVVVRPRLSEGFQRAAGRVFAQGLAERAQQDVEIALPEGQRLFRVPIVPGLEAGESDEAAELQAARSLAGFYLDPSSVDWSRGQIPTDTNGDGRPDRFQVRDELEGVLWTGDDGDGDGEVDFVRADVWWDGQVDYAAFRTERGWEQTNLCDAWLEMGFSLPWARSAYEAHDVDLVLNGAVVGTLRDQIPEGNYAFELPPTALRFTPEGAPDEQEIEIRSTHLRGGHYVVSSDFDLRTRMTGTHVWAAGTDAEDARRRALADEGLTIARPDYSVSSAEVRVTAPPGVKKGDAVEVAVPIRNLGAATTPDVTVALVARGAGGGDVEIARQRVEAVPLQGAAEARFRWNAGAGQLALRVVVDPDHEIDDWNRANDEARVTLAVAGDDAPPTVQLEGIAPDAVLRDNLFTLRAATGDDAGIARVEARIDDGLWRELPAGAAGVRTVRGLLQPGAHTIAVRATDGAGNRTEAALPVRVDVPRPEATMLEPADGATIAGPSTTMRVATGPDAAKAMVRVNGGPWIRAPIRNGVAEAEVPVGFGPAALEAMVVDPRGVRNVAGRQVRGTAQPVPGADGFRPDYVVDDFRLPFEGFGDLDLTADPDFLFVEPPPDVAPDPAPDAAPAAAPAVVPPGEPARAPWTPTPDAAPRAPTGGLVASRRPQSSWYCTNRPRIRVPFRLPEWLQRLELPPPGSAEFERMIDKLIGRLRAQGVDTRPLERFQEFLERKCDELEDPRELPGWLESVGLGRGAKIPDDELQRRREQMLDRTRAWWLRLLASGDAALVEAGLRARMDAFRSFDEGLSENAQAAIDSIRAHQTLIEDLTEGLPVVGEAMDLYAVITGERILNGEEISTFERVIRAGGLLAPKILEEVFKRSRLAQKGAVWAGEKLTVAGKWGKDTLSGLTKVPTRDIDAFLTKVQRALTSEISLTKWRMGREAEAAGRAFANGAEGVADLARQADDLAQARDLLRRLDDVADDGAFERMVVDSFQTNKTAQRVVNSDAATDALRARINRSMRGVYDDVDKGAVEQLSRMLRASDDELALLASRSGRNVDELRRFRDGMQDLARRNGIDPADLRVRTQDFSGLDPRNPGRSVGRDRDVTFAVFGPDGKHLEDVHHAISRDVYEDALWLRTRGEPLPDVAAVRAHADALDQMVTSRWHPEAYASGETGFRNFLNGTGTTTRVEDVLDTVRIKSEHWWHLAANEADPIRAAQQVAEGMRQATKQWDRIIEPRVAQYMRNTSLAAQIKVPADLQVGIDIFRRAETGAITPRQADAMLSRIGLTKEGVLNQMAGFFETVEKDVGRQFRRIGAAQLDDVLRSSALPRGSTEWANDAIDQINDALKHGYVSEEVFRSRRTGVLSAMQEKIVGDGSPGAFSALESWVGRALTDRRISRLEARALREWIATQRDG